MTSKIQAMKTLRTNSKAFIASVEKYILECIDHEGTDTEKLQLVYDRFISEYSHNWRRHNNTKNLLASWFMGLPSTINIDSEYRRMIELAKEWHLLSPDATDRQEQAVINNWFSLMAFRLIRLSEKHGITY